MTQPIKLLLVEDDDLDAMDFRRAMKRVDRNVEIQRASDGAEALALLKTQQQTTPYLIILDLNLPRMSGFEFLDMIEQDTRAGPAAVFILSSSDAERDIQRAYRHRIAGYLVKSDQDDALLEVTKMLQGYWKHNRLPIPA
ncbi:MAG: response regulator [Myxococcota bacterium]